MLPGFVQMLSGTRSNGSSLSPSGLTTAQTIVVPPSTTPSREFLKPTTTAVKLIITQCHGQVQQEPTIQ